MTKYLKYIVWMLRLLVGATFIFSGVAKCLDPWGFVYKIADYLSVWGWPLPHAVVVCGAITLSVFELVVGVCLLFGMLRRVAVWCGAAMMLFMLPLTFYIWVANPVADCGCFGDMWHISNGATLLKNVALTAMIVLLWIYNRRIKAYISPYVQWLAIAFTAAYGLTVALMGYLVQPAIDFRPFPRGFDMQQLANQAAADEVEYEFLYAPADGGEPQAFSVDSLPDEDQGWTFVDRRERQRPQEAATAAALAIFTADGDDATADVFDQMADTLMLVLVPNPSAVDLNYWRLANRLGAVAPTVAIVGSQLIGQEPLPNWQIPYYTADDTAITQLARGPVALVCTVDGKVVWKRSADLLATDFTPATAADIGQLAPFDLRRTFWLLTGFLALVLFLLTTDRLVTLLSALHHKRIKE